MKMNNVLFTYHEHAFKHDMRLIAVSNLKAFWEKHPNTKAPLERWASIVKEASWNATADVQSAFSTAKVLGGERVRFEISGGDYRLIASFKFKNQLVWVKFIGTHAEYDKIDALTVSMFLGSRDGYPPDPYRRRPPGSASGDGASLELS